LLWLGSIFLILSALHQSVSQFDRQSIQVELNYTKNINIIREIIILTEIKNREETVGNLITSTREFPDPPPTPTYAWLVTATGQ